MTWPWSTSDDLESRCPVVWRDHHHKVVSFWVPLELEPSDLHNALDERFPPETSEGGREAHSIVAHRSRQTGRKLFNKKLQPALDAVDKVCLYNVGPPGRSPQLGDIISMLEDGNCHAFDVWCKGLHYTSREFLWEKLTDDDVDECSICCESLLVAGTDGSRALSRAASCLHLFHTSCLGDWLMKKQNCPLCNMRCDANEIASARFVATHRGEDTRKMAGSA